jgi:hypothetical protein
MPLGHPVLHAAARVAADTESSVHVHHVSADNEVLHVSWLADLAVATTSNALREPVIAGNANVDVMGLLVC